MTERALPRLILDAVEEIASATAEGAPFLLNRDPAPDEQGVPLGSAIALEVASHAAGGNDPTAVRVWVGDALAFDGARAEPLDRAFTGAGSGVSRGLDALRLVLVPHAPFTSRATVRVRVVASELDTAYTFHAEDRTPPCLLAAIAAGPRLVRLVFDEPVTPTASTRVTFEPLDVPAVGAELADVRAVGVELHVVLSRVLSPGQRYRVRVHGAVDAAGNVVAPPDDSATLVAFAPPRPDARRFDLLSMLPKHNRRRDTTGDLAKFVGCLQEVTDLLLAEIDRLGDMLDLERAPESVLDRILHDLGNPFAFDLTPPAKRRLASLLVRIYQQKGTAPGIRNVLRFFMGLDGVVVQPLSVERAPDGSILGGSGGLAPSARFLRYAFEVVIPVTLSGLERHYVHALVRFMKPAHTHFVRLVEPHTSIPHEAWELGNGELGSQPVA